MLAGAVAHEAVLIDTGPRDGIVSAVLDQLLAAGADIEIIMVIVAERGTLEAVGSTAHMIEDRDMGLDTALMDKPGKIGGIAIARIGGQASWPDAEAFLRPVDHRSLRRHLGLADGGSGLHIDDDGIGQIDEVVAPFWTGWRLI